MGEIARFMTRYGALGARALSGSRLGNTP
jgi:hypothetical protein